jgi:hypothetical protein
VQCPGGPCAARQGRHFRDASAAGPFAQRDDEDDSENDMAAYTVHQPPLKADQAAPPPERFAFVRDGFSFWAFLFGPLWMLRHRMWLVLLGYLAVMVLLQLGLHLVGASQNVRVAVALLVAILVGLEAATLRRFTLKRRRWRELGVVVGDSRDEAERRFFATSSGTSSASTSSGSTWADNAVSGRARAPTAPAPAPVPRPRAETAPDVIGLFPEAGAPR